MADRRRNLTLNLGHANSPFSPVPSGSGQSPMTALSNIMTGLSCVGSTPKRKLSLSDISATPTPPGLSFSRNSSQSSDAGVSLTSGSGSPCRIEDVDDSLFSLSRSFGRAKDRRKMKSALRRFNSIPASFSLQPCPSVLPISSSHDDFALRTSLESPDEEEELIFYSSNLTANEQTETLSTESNNSSTSNFSSLQPHESFSPHPEDALPSVKRRSISAPASLLNQVRVQTTINDDEPCELKHSRLTSTDDDGDDGFCDIFDSDSQGSTGDVSEALAGLISAPIIKTHSSAGQPSTDHPMHSFVSPSSLPLQTIDCNAMEGTPEPKCRRGIFKVPSQPAIKRSASFLKRPDRPRDTPSPIQKKKRSVSIASPSPSQNICKDLQKQHRPSLVRSFSEADFKKIDGSLSSDTAFADLIGDRSKRFILPVTDGKHSDLKNITPETLAALIRKEYEEEVEEFFIVDSRYPYEFDGGHIKGALNLYKQDQVTKFFLNLPMKLLKGRRVIVFHCEFSSKRGPDLLKFLRNEDRNSNLQNYPALFYPELYLLAGGYKAFFESQKELCEPPEYKPMLHKDHGEDLRHFKAKSKSWQGEQRSRLNLRYRSLVKK